MSFLSPLWLVALLPWAALVLWLLLGLRLRVDVPFVGLWPREQLPPSQRRHLRRPPLAVAALLIAALLAVLAASRPLIHWGIGRSGPEICIILDHGLTMSARGEADWLFRELANHSAPPMRELAGDGPVRLVAVPDGRTRITDRYGWVDLARALPPTAVDTHRALASAVLDALMRSTGLVIVVSNQPLPATSSRVVAIRPQRTPSNVGIVRLAVRDSPRPQLMVAVRNGTALAEAALLVRSDDRAIARQTLELPSGGGQRNYFVDLAEMGTTLAVELIVDDDLPADNRAALVRESAWPAVEPAGTLPAAVQRMIETYGRHRPPSADSARLSVGGKLPADRRGVLLMPAAEAGPVGDAEVADHPVTRAVGAWPGGGVDPAGQTDTNTWTVLVRRGGRMLVGARTAPARQVGVWMHLDEWAKTADFVMFWTNVFDWVGEGGPHYAAHGVGLLADEWTAGEAAAVPAGTPPGLWPGLYRRGDGAWRAVNALDIRLQEQAATDWLSDLSAAVRSTGAPPRRGVELSAILALLALGFIALAAMTWRPVARVVRSARPRPAQTSTTMSESGSDGAPRSAPGR